LGNMRLLYAYTASPAGGADPGVCMLQNRNGLNL